MRHGYLPCSLKQLSNGPSCQVLASSSTDDRLLRVVLLYQCRLRRKHRRRLVRSILRHKLMALHRWEYPILRAWSNRNATKLSSESRNQFCSSASLPTVCPDNELHDVRE